jgi:hypothetical protein
MFDYSTWIGTARDFVSSLVSLPGEVNVETSVAPPMTQHEADVLARSLPMGLPRVIRDFLTEGSSRCECRYWWEPPARPWPELREIFPSQNFIDGGPSFCHPEILADLQESRLDWAEGFDGDDDESRRDRELWTRSAPFSEIGNGDLLALDISEDTDDPPVVYLSHEGGSNVIAPSFNHFLQHWEVMSYIGPEIWLLNDWIDGRSGWIDSNHQKSPLLRSLLTRKP